MKRILSIIALLIFTVLITPVADAKKFGGSKSFGKSFKTAPKTSNFNSTKNNTNTAQAANNNKKGLFGGGMLGGMLGGLLAGGLIASLFGGGAFAGIQFLDILIMAAIAFMIFTLARRFLAAKQENINRSNSYGFKTKNIAANSAYSVNQNNYQGATNIDNNSYVNLGFGSKASVLTDDVPHNYLPNFDMPAFLNGACEHYRILQIEWNLGKFDLITEYVSADMLVELKAERAQLPGEQHTQVMYVDAEIVRADHNASVAQLSVQFSGRYRDTYEGVEEDITDIWHLERDLLTPNAPWIIVGITN